MKTSAGLAACVSVLWVSAESVEQPAPHVTSEFEVPLLEDRAGLRIRCDSGDGTACTAFLDCRDQGEVRKNLSGEVGVIPDQATRSMTRRDISDMTNVTDLTWPLSCKVRSTHPVQVKVLVRTRPFYF